MGMRKFFTMLLTTVVLSGNATTVFADENEAGKIHFTGEIIAPSCTIKGDTGKDSTVPLGTYPTSRFKAQGDESDLIPFSITLTGCPATSDGLPAVQLTFNGTTTLSNTSTIMDVSAITTKGGSAATGVGIAITPKEKPTQYIAFDGSDEQVWIDLPASASTDISADFNARYKSYSTTVTAGPADADLTVNILYR